MDKGKFVFLLTVVTLLLSGCISISMKSHECNDRSVTKQFRLDKFDKITQKTIADVVIRQGKTQSVSVKASQDFMKYLKLEVISGNLIISSIESGKKFPNCEITVEVTVPSLTKIQSDGTGDFEFIGQFKENKLTAVLNGTGDINIPDFSGEVLDFKNSGTGDIDAKGKCSEIYVNNNGTGECDIHFSGLNSLDIISSGTGDVDAEGSVNNAKYILSGTGNIKSKEMKAINVTAMCSGTGDISCYASESFKGTRDGTGKITCYGNPPRKDYSADGYKFPN